MPRKSTTSPQPIPHLRGKSTPNRSRIEGDHAVIELTNIKDETIAEVRVSIGDLPRVLARGRWNCSRRKNRTYAVRSYREHGEARAEYLHRFVMDAPEGMHVDHIDGDGLNDRRENLRLVTPSQNMQNRHCGEKMPQSGVRNVHWDTKRSLWFVKIGIGRRQTYHGHFATVEEAAPVAKAARRALHTHCPENSVPTEADQ